ncbi:hypothetical protein ES703_119215 [subsurface metagenome]
MIQSAVFIVVLPVVEKGGVHANACRAVGDGEVAPISPASAPTVLDYPATGAITGVREAIVPTDYQHRMVGIFRSGIMKRVGTVIGVESWEATIQ